MAIVLKLTDTAQWASIIRQPSFSTCFCIFLYIKCTTLVVFYNNQFFLIKVFLTINQSF